jgi:hypothetical protein
MKMILHHNYWFLLQLAILSVWFGYPIEIKYTRLKKTLKQKEKVMKEEVFFMKKTAQSFSVTFNACVSSWAYWDLSSITITFRMKNCVYKWVFMVYIEKFKVKIVYEKVEKTANFAKTFISSVLFRNPKFFFDQFVVL